jgi:hypothetical protein
MDTKTKTERVKWHDVLEEIQHLQIVEAVYWNRTRQCALEVTKYAKLATQASAAIQRLSESAWENQKRKNL